MKILRSLFAVLQTLSSETALNVFMLGDIVIWVAYPGLGFAEWCPMVEGLTTDMTTAGQLAKALVQTELCLPQLFLFPFHPASPHIRMLGLSEQQLVRFTECCHIQGPVVIVVSGSHNTPDGHVPYYGKVEGEDAARTIGQELMEKYVTAQCDPLVWFWPPCSLLPFPVPMSRKVEVLKSLLSSPFCQSFSGEACASKEGYQYNPPWPTPDRSPLLVHILPAPGNFEERVKISGLCEFWHYGVDGFQDIGWGCAYRSLQMQLSWFRLVGAPVKCIPSIPELQSILIRTGVDSSLGKTSWIGSYEVSALLQHLVEGVVCKIEHLPSGDAFILPAFLRRVHDHFLRFQSPIMIGGSQKAFVLAGLAANFATCEAKFLIMDPHYTVRKRSDDNDILQKGFIGWKDPSVFFEVNDWYNVCFPQAEW